MVELARRALRRRLLRDAVATYFASSDDPRHVVRRQTVGQVVAAVLGERWSSALGAELAPIVPEVLPGAAPIRFCNRRLWKGVRPRQASPEEVEHLAATLRRNPPKDAALERNP